jgi:hypothetical protein
MSVLVGLLFVLIVFWGIAALFGLPMMLVFNALVGPLIGAPDIGFWEAVGLTMLLLMLGGLAKIIFGRTSG